MRRLTTTLCLILFVLGSAGCAKYLQDVEIIEGLRAFLREDYAIARRIFEPLAIQGNDSAQLNLGMMYQGGYGVPQNNKTALKWYRLAAEQGNARAQNYAEQLQKTIAAAKASPPTQRQPRQRPSNLPPCPTDQNEWYIYCFGTYDDGNGNKWVGEWLVEKLHGYGTYTSANGDKYVGEFSDNEFDGQGTLVFANGNKYVGEFQYDKFHGQGTLTYANGRVEDGIWEDGKFKYAQKISPTQKQPEQIPSNLPLDKAEKKCAEIGFTKGTEKFGDCVMKLLD